MATAKGVHRNLDRAYHSKSNNVGRIYETTKEYLEFFGKNPTQLVEGKTIESKIEVLESLGYVALVASARINELGSEIQSGELQAQGESYLNAAEIMAEPTPEEPKPTMDAKSQK